MVASSLTLVAWLLTYLIHSTLLLAGAWLLEALFAPESMRLRERLWRVALLGGLVTASAQLALGLAIPAPRWTLERAVPAVAASSPASIEGPASAALPTRESSRARPPVARDEPVESRVLPAEPIRRAPLALPVIPPGLGSLSEKAPAASGASFLAELERLSRAASLPTWLALAALATGLTVLFQLGLSAARLRRRLAGAVEIRTGPEVELLAALARRARLARPVRLFVAPQLCSPLSSGLVRPAVYVPPRALCDLSGEEREAMLAHELAHVARRDPAWLTLFWLVERACFFQPLNRLARRRLAHSAEVLADDWAVRYTGRHLSLASCLARIAGWMTEGPRLLGAHLANGTEDVEGGERPRSQLARRIERLLEGRPRGDERQRWWSPLALGVLGSLALVAPGVAAHRPVSVPVPAPRPAPLPRSRGCPSPRSSSRPRSSWPRLPRRCRAPDAPRARRGLQWPSTTSCARWMARSSCSRTSSRRSARSSPATRSTRLWPRRSTRSRPTPARSPRAATGCRRTPVRWTRISPGSDPSNHLPGDTTMQTFVPTLVLALGAGSSLVYAAAELGEGRACKAQSNCAPACEPAVVAPVAPVAPLAPMAPMVPKAPKAQKAPAPCVPSVAPHIPHTPHVEAAAPGSVVWGHAPAALVSVAEPVEPHDPQEPAEACAALARIEAGMAELQQALSELDLSALEVDAAEYAEAAAAWAPLVAEGAEDFLASLANLEELQNLEDLESLEDLGGLEGLKHLAELYALEACGTGSDCGHECCQDAEAQDLGAHAAESARKALAEVERSLGRSGGGQSAAQAYARALERAQPFTTAPAQGGDDELRGLLGELRTEVENLRGAVRDLRVQVDALSRTRGTGQALRPVPGPTASTAPSWNLTQPSGGAR